MVYILIDVGSTTIKAYKFSGNKLVNLEQISVHFKNNFSKGNIDEDDKDMLVKFIKSLTRKFPKAGVKTYATSIFRDMSQSHKSKLIEELYTKTGVLLNIIDQTAESLYLQLALVGKFNTKKNLMLVNIGGGSTELVIIKNNKPIERKNIGIGVGTLISKFPTINDSISGVGLKNVVNFVQSKLLDLENNAEIAFYTGGELKYMMLAKYPLVPNNLFIDKEHPWIIYTDNLSQKNDDIFSSITLKALENLMVENPKWMHGARPCSALAQAIFQQYKVKTVIPSNSNIIDGVVRYEFGM